MKTFGIIGAGNIGKAVAYHLVKAGYPVTISNSKGPESLKDTIAALGGTAKAGTAEEAAQADIVVLALPWAQMPTVTNLTDWTNRIVIDTSNAFITFEPDFQVADLGGRASSEVVAGYVPGAKLVKAFNTFNFKILGSDPQVAGGNRVLFISGDDAAAKKEVKDAIKSMGFAAVDMGTLAGGSKLQEPKGPLSNLNLIKLA